MAKKSEAESIRGASVDKRDLKRIQRAHERLLISMREEAEPLNDPLLLRLYDTLIMRVITGA